MILIVSSAINSYFDSIFGIYTDTVISVASLFQKHFVITKREA